MSVGVLAVVLHEYSHPGIIRAFAALEIEPPGLTVLCLNLGLFFRSPAGLMAAGGIVLAGYLPLAFGAKGPWVVKAYATAAVATLCAAGLFWLGTALFIAKLQEMLGAPG